MLSTADCRIHVSRCTARWDDRPVTAAEAMDFWSFAAAAANVVMQLAWPAVGYGVVESKVDSGSLMKHPWKRLRTTSQYLAVAVLGSDEDRAAFRDAVDVAHRDVKSTPDSPVRYNAFDRELQMWVAACLFVGLEDTYQLLRGEMTADQAEQFYRSAWTLGTTLQVTEDQWPTTREAFDAYWNTAAERVVIDEPVRRYLFDLLNLRMISPFLALPFRPLLKFLTAGFLAPVFRDALGVRWNDARQRWFERLFLLVAFANRFLPVFVRQGGSYVLTVNGKLWFRPLSLIPAVAKRPVLADYYISAVPCEKLAPLLNAAVLAADPTLANVVALRTEWMNGLMFFLRERVDVTKGHVNYVDSGWGITSISQAQFWKRRFTEYGDHTVLDAAGYRGARAAIAGLFQAPWWEPFKAADRARYRAKLPNVLDVVDARWPT